MRNINFSLTDLYYSFVINNYLVQIFRKAPECFFDTVNINAVSGKIPNVKFSLVIPKQKINNSTVENMVRIYNENSLEICLICDRENIREIELEDEFSNFVLETLNRGKNKVFLSSPLLKDYILSKYQNIETVDLSNNNYIKVNPVCCRENCDFYSLHKKVFEENIDNPDFNYFPCPLKSDFNFFRLKNNKNFISSLQIQEEKENRNYLICSSELIKTSFLNYSQIDIIESYVYYLVKNEYKNEIRYKLLNNSLIKIKEKCYG